MCSSWIFDWFFGDNKPVVKELWILPYNICPIHLLDSLETLVI